RRHPLRPAEAVAEPAKAQPARRRPKQEGTLVPGKPLRDRRLPRLQLRPLVCGQVLLPVQFLKARGVEEAGTTQQVDRARLRRQLRDRHVHAGPHPAEKSDDQDPEATGRRQRYGIHGVLIGWFVVPPSGGPSPARRRYDEPRGDYPINALRSWSTSFWR